MSTTERHLHLYDGRDMIGMVVDRGDCFHAFDRAGVWLGEFPKRKAAVAAVNSSVPLRSCVADSSARMDGSG